MNPYNIDSDYGNSSDDIRHRFVGNYVWHLPFFTANTHAFLRTTLGSWSLSGIATIQTGLPVNITITQDQANTGQSSQRPNRVGPIHGRCGEVIVNCINRDAFALPAQYTYGNSARNPFYGPGLVNFDTALAKTFPIHDRMAFQLRADAYNTFNHVNWARPVVTGLRLQRLETSLLLPPTCGSLSSWDASYSNFSLQGDFALWLRVQRQESVPGSPFLRISIKHTYTRSTLLIVFSRDMTLAPSFASRPLMSYRSMLSSAAKGTAFLGGHRARSTKSLRKEQREER